ncbi:hypothetical protein JTB14_015716 [Gonioctena quinquepunctata]|nr:hypothetical protein JTB14_015716 [Gonioctena quinquepunctata]
MRRRKRNPGMADFNQADSSALLILTVNMTKETLEKVMRFLTTRDMWLELHSLFDGNVENKTYDVCSTDLGIIYKPGAQEELKTFSDADHGGDDTTGRSTTGVLSMYADGAISWYSQRQTSVAISTTEAEIVAASEAAREIVWLKRLFDEIIVLRAVPTLMVDNEAAIKLAENPEYHRRTKHIHIRHFFVRELVVTVSFKFRKCHQKTS